MKASTINDVDTASLKDFATILLSEGTVVFETPCKTDAVADVTIDGENINHYMPTEWRRSNGSSTHQAAEGNLVELLEKSEGKTVTIYNYNGDVVGFTIIEGKKIKFTSYECV